MEISFAAGAGSGHLAFFACDAIHPAFFIGCGLPTCRRLILEEVASSWAEQVDDVSRPGFSLDSRRPSASGQQSVAIVVSSPRPSGARLSSRSSSSVARSAPPVAPGGNVCDEITPPISDLAAALNYDLARIFEYVYNNIDFEPYFGATKGATLTLYEKSGNEFDQSALLVALLRAAGKNPSSQFAACDFTYEELVNWIGLSNSPYAHLTDDQFKARYSFPGSATATAAEVAKWRKRFTMYETLVPRGYFYLEPFTFQGREFFSLPHTWVRLVEGGVTYDLSPSFKVYTKTTGIGLAAAMGYNRASLLADIGGTTTATSATSLDYPTLSNRLKSYGTNLLTFLRDNESTHPAADITGRRRIDIDYSFTTLSDTLRIFPYPEAEWLIPQTWTAIPEAQHSKLQIQAGTYNYTAATPAFSAVTFNQTISSPALQGRKISLAFNGNTA